MRNQAVNKILTAVAILVVGFIGQACDDGELGLDRGVAPSITPYVAITAEPMSVEKGGSTTLTWTVANADTVQITGTSASGDFSFNSEPMDMAGETEGSLVVDQITATTTFTITASAMVATPDIVEPEMDPYVPLSVGLNVHKSGQITIPEEEPQLSMSPVDVTDSVTVTVTDEGPLSASLTATPSRISEGQKSCLCWEVSSAATSFEISSTAGDTITATDECNFDNSTDITESTDTGDGVIFQLAPVVFQLRQPFVYISKAMGIGEAKAETTGLPNSGCATVSPPAPGAVYTVTAHDAAGNQASDSATLGVDVANFDPNGSYIRAEGQHPKYQTDSFDNPVTIDFGIMPAHLDVSVEADKSSAECGVDGSAALPTQDVLSDGTGTSECNLTEDTTFTLYAHINGQKRFVDMVMVIGAAGAGRVKITAQPWAFEGEEVNVKVEAKTSADAQLIDKIRIVGQSIVERTDVSTTPITETVVVPTSGVRIEVYSSSDDTPQSFQAVQALPLMPIGVIGEPITEVMFDPNDITRSYYGVINDISTQGVSFTQTLISMHRSDDLSQDSNVNGELDIPFGALLAMYDPAYADVIYGQNSAQFVGFRDYPISAIAVPAGEPDTIFAGSYGGIVASHDGGTTWQLVWKPLLELSYHGGDRGTHESCAGDTAHGSIAEEPGNVISFANVCDIILDGSRLIAATDRGMLTIRDIQTAIDNPKASGNVKHLIDESENPADAGFPMFTHVVNDLEKATVNGSTKIFAAVANGNLNEAYGEARGVFVSSETTEAALGETWTQFGLESEDVFSLTVDMHDGEAKKLYAGTASGIFVSDLSSPNWQRVESSMQIPQYPDVEEGDGDSTLMPDENAPANNAVSGIYALADDPYTTGVIMAGHANGVKITRDGGQNWGSLLAGGLSNGGKVRAISLVGEEDSATGMINYRAAFGSTDGYLAGKVLAPKADTEITIESPDDNGDDTPPEDDNSDDTVVTDTVYQAMQRPATYYRIPSDDE